VSCKQRVSLQHQLQHDDGGGSAGTRGVLRGGHSPRTTRGAPGRSSSRPARSAAALYKITKTKKKLEEIYFHLKLIKSQKQKQKQNKNGERVGTWLGSLIQGRPVMLRRRVRSQVVGGSCGFFFLYAGFFLAAAGCCLLPAAAAGFFPSAPPSTTFFCFSGASILGRVLLLPLLVHAVKTALSSPTASPNKLFQIEIGHAERKYFIEEIHARKEKEIFCFGVFLKKTFNLISRDWK
jgi:hypothetical protein